MADDELLAGRRTPRLVLGAVVVVGLALVAALVVGVAHALQRGPQAAPAPSVASSFSSSVGTSSSSVPPPVRQQTAAPAASVTGPVLPGSRRPASLAVAAIGRTVYVLQAGVLRTVNRTGGDRQVPVSRPAFGVHIQTLLLADPVAGRLWVVGARASSSLVVEYDAATLRQIRVVTVQRDVMQAAALAGRLYLADRHTVSMLMPGGATPRHVWTIGAPNYILALAAEPKRSRLLVLAPPRIASFRPDGSHSVSDARFRDIVKGYLHVTGSGEVWLTGFGQSGAILERLDPPGFASRQGSDVRSRFDPGAMVIGGGQHQILVESGSGSGELWCVNARTGDGEQLWTVNAADAAVSGSTGYVVDDQGEVVQLRLADTCTN